MDVINKYMTKYQVSQHICCVNNCYVIQQHYHTYSHHISQIDTLNLQLIPGSNQANARSKSKLPFSVPKLINQSLFQTIKDPYHNYVTHNKIAIQYKRTIRPTNNKT